eukprot:m.76364 g.76364  ORF g.76364 m.76364 type:complete len:685 (+) comp14509_c0_seq1:50-2104(+)
MATAWAVLALVGWMALASTALTTNNTTKQAAKKPNFLILFADDLGINQIAVDGALYGYTGDGGTVATPNLNKLASEGILFQNWYSSLHLCSPSRASMMTGRYSIRVGIGISNKQYAPNAPGPDAGVNLVLSAEAIGGLPLNETTFSELLKPAGYATMMIGKWHLGVRDIYLPTSRGFDEYYGIPFSQDMGTSFWEYRAPRAPYQPTPVPLLNGTTIVEQPVGLHTLAARYASAASNFIRQSVSKSKPFCLYLPFNHVHGPNSCSASFCGKSTRGPIGDAVEEMDWAIGQIMAALKEVGADDDTLVFFTSDNGAPLGGDQQGNLPLRDGKSSTWEGGFREPGIVRWPGRISPGRLSTEIVSTMDIYPTMMKLAGVPLPADRIIDGVDMSPILFADDQPKISDGTLGGHECYFFYDQSAAINAAGELYGVRCGDNKAYWNIRSTRKQPWHGPQNPPLMFNLTADPGETKPLASSSIEYQTAMAVITEARERHLATITIVPNQNGRGSDPQYAFCANATAVPGPFPNCTISPENWAPKSICSSKACLERSGYPQHCRTPPPSPQPPPPPTPSPCPGPKCPPVPQSNSIGCFHDHKDGRCDLPVVRTGHCEHEKHAALPNMDVELCNSLCQDYAFFGVQMGGLGCFCGNKYGSEGEAPISQCNVTCAGNTSEVCGGPNLNSVFKVVEA